MQISGNIIDIEAERIFPGTLEIKHGRIVRVREEVGPYDHFVLPGFIDSHIHIESTMLTPSQFARLAVTHGTVAVVSDPHEIANVLGLEGVRFMLENAATVPLPFYFGAPSCVPATPFETAGGVLGLTEIEELFRDGRVRYLSEMMNVPGVLHHDAEVEAKLTMARQRGLRIDGHAPGLVGEPLQRYVEAGISADHETISLAEGEEKIRLGMKVQIREGSAAKNFTELFPLLDRYPGQCMFCSDDLHPDDLTRGQMNLLVKRALAQGAGLYNVLRAACLTPIRHYGLNSGLLRMGDQADCIVLNNLRDCRVLATYLKGIKVAEEGRALFSTPAVTTVNNFQASPCSPEEFAILATGSRIRVITVTDGQLITGRSNEEVRKENGLAVADPGRDILKISVVNRYTKDRPAVGFVKNFGLHQGAFASSVAHDSHNIIAVGCDDRSICRAVNLIIDAMGGLAAVDGNEELFLPLPIAGLMSDADGLTVAERYQALDAMVKRLGSPLAAPFMTLSFMALLVIPALKLSDQGLFDGETFQFTELFCKNSGSS